MGTESLLPLHSRSPSHFPVLNRLWRSKERLLLGFMCLALVVICFGTVFFVPDLRTGMAVPSMDSVYKVYHQVRNAGPEFILPLPPLVKDEHQIYGQHHGQIDKPDFHLLEDQARLQAKMELEEREELERNQQRVLQRPLIPDVPSLSASSTRYLLGMLSYSICTYSLK